MSNFADEADERMNGKSKTTKKEKAKKPLGKRFNAWIKREVWDSRPINWLGIGLCYVCVAYTTFRFASYWVNYPELTGIAAFVATLAIGSRAFKKRV